MTFLLFFPNVSTTYRKGGGMGGGQTVWWGVQGGMWQKTLVRMAMMPTGDHTTAHATSVTIYIPVSNYQDLHLGHSCHYSLIQCYHDLFSFGQTPI